MGPVVFQRSRFNHITLSSSPFSFFFEYVTYVFLYGGRAESAVHRTGAKQGNVTRLKRA